MAPTLWAKTTDQHHRNATKSNPQVTAPAQTPIDPAARFHRTHDMLAQMLVERGPPGNERETHAIVDHCEPARCERDALAADAGDGRSEEHTSELQSLMRISYAVFCLNKKKIYMYTMSTI